MVFPYVPFPYVLHFKIDRLSKFFVIFRRSRVLRWNYFRFFLPLSPPCTLPRSKRTISPLQTLVLLRCIQTESDEPKYRMADYKPGTVVSMSVTGVGMIGLTMGYGTCIYDASSSKYVLGFVTAGHLGTFLPLRLRMNLQAQRLFM